MVLVCAVRIVSAMSGISVQSESGLLTTGIEYASKWSKCQRTIRPSSNFILKDNGPLAFTIVPGSQASPNWKLRTRTVSPTCIG